MQADIQKAIDSGKLTVAGGEALANLPPGTFVQHKSWGFGQIASIDFLIHQVTIDFKTKKGHPMQLQYAAESLIAIPATHIAARKFADLPAVKEQAKADLVGITRAILNSFGGKASQEQIQQSLVPDVMSEADFKKWFENAKKALKNDGHFAIPTKKGLPFELRDGPISHADEYLSAFNNARQIKDQIKAIELIIKHLAEFKDPTGQLQPVIIALNDGARKSANLKPDETIALLAARDELIERVSGLDRGADALGIASILSDQRAQLSILLSKVPDSKLPRAIAAIPAAFGDDWPQRAIGVLLRAEKPRLAAEVATLITKEKRQDDLRTALERSISDHSLGSAALCWLCSDRLGAFSELLDHKVASAIIAALERDAHNERKDRKLHDLLLNDQELLPELVADASSEELRDYMRKLLFTTVFEDLNRRSLLGRLVRVYPELATMISGGDDSEEDKSLIVSWESLERRKAELDELVKKKIPENVKEISIARSYGDLRENFEFKAAKEMQRVLNRRRAEMERDLSLARGTDFASTDSSQVNIGCVVTLKESNGRGDRYTILGAWDGDPEKGIVSYLSALAKSLLGHKVGDQLDVPTEHGDRKVTIEAIEAWKK